MNRLIAHLNHKPESRVRVAALTQGTFVPSTRFRVEQHIDNLALHGVEINHIPAKFGAYPPVGMLRRIEWLPRALADSTLRSLQANDADLCLLQRELISTLYTAERIIRKPIVLDVDDAVFLHKRGRSIDEISKRASLIICGNTFLAEHFSKFGTVEVLPTAVDASRFVPMTIPRERPVIGWSGTSSGFKYLESIQEPLRIVLQRFPDAVLSIVADRPPALTSIPEEQLIFTRWSPANEVQVLQSFSVGIMPLNDTPWSRGKCSFKMLTYMAVGVPVVASPVGMNREVLALGDCGLSATNTDDWVDVLVALLRDRDRSTRMGMTGRRIVESHYSREVITPRLANLLLGISK